MLETKREGVRNMECYTCKDKMKCVDDINQEMLRVDFFECTRCESVAEVTYGAHGKYILTVSWKRDE